MVVAVGIEPTRSRLSARSPRFIKPRRSPEPTTASEPPRAAQATRDNKGELERPTVIETVSPRWQRSARPSSYGRKLGGDVDSRNRCRRSCKDRPLVRSSSPYSRKIWFGDRRGDGGAPKSHAEPCCRRQGSREQVMPAHRRRRRQNPFHTIKERRPQLSRSPRGRRSRCAEHRDAKHRAKSFPSQPINFRLRSRQ